MPSRYQFMKPMYVALDRTISHQLLSIIFAISIFLISNSSFAQTTLLSDPGTTRNDTGGTVADTYGTVDVSNCTSVTFTFDYSFSLPWEGDGNMETAEECRNFGPCAGDPTDPQETGCNNCWDFLEVNFLLDGSSVGGDLIGDDGTDNSEQFGSITETVCTNGATSASIEALTQSWAGDEGVSYSNITIVCFEGIPEATANPDPLCASDVLNLEGLVDDAGVIDIIDWTGPGTIDDPSSLITTADGLSAPSATFTLTTTDVNGCAASSDVTVDVNELIIMDPASIEICYSLIPFRVEVLNLDDIEQQITNFDPSLTVNWYFDADGTDPLDWFDPNDLLRIVTNFITTVYASTTDGVCESNIIPVSVNLTEYPLPDDVDIELCADESGEAVFDPTDYDNDFNGGDGSLAVTYHFDQTDAQDGVGAISGQVSTFTDITLFARVENAQGCAGVGALNVTLLPQPIAGNAILTACDNGFGEGEFDLTTVESDILNGANGLVNYYEDIDLTIEILAPDSYVSPANTVYAAFEDENGCPSSIGEITLELLSFQPEELGLDISPTTGCGSTEIEVILITPFDPPGEYSYEVSYGPQVSGPDTDVILTGQDGDLVLTLTIDESYIFEVYSVTVPPPTSCTINFDDPITYTITINNGQDALPAQSSQCANRDGSPVTFDLTNLSNTVNGGTGNTVLYYTDMAAMMPIANPTVFSTSTTTTVYARVDDGTGCLGGIAPITITVNGLPSFEITPVDISCNGTMDGGFNITNQVGAMPFTYNWSDMDIENTPNPDNLGPGVYDVTVTDANNCSTASNAFTLTDPPALTISCTELRPATTGMMNGQAQFTITTGVAPYEYILTGPIVVAAMDIPAGTTTIDNLFAGDYFLVVIDSEGCEATCNITINENPPSCDLNLSITDTDITCQDAANGTIDLTINSSFATTNIDWNVDNYDGIEDPINIISPGQYTVTVTDANNCMATATTEITEPMSLTLNCGNTTNPSVINGTDGSLNPLISGGTSPYSLTWTGPVNGMRDNDPDGSAPITNLSAGTYTLMVEDANNCMTTCMFTLTDPGCDLSVSCMENPVGVGDGPGSYTYTITGGTAPYRMERTGPDPAIIPNIPNAGDFQTGPLQSGDYTILIIDANGCRAECSFTEDDCTLELICRANTTGQGNGPDSYTFTFTNGTGLYTLDLTGPIAVSFVQMDTFYNSPVLPEGEYTFTVTDDAGCSESCTFTIADLCTDFAVFIDPTVATCASEADGSLIARFFGGSGPYLYDWSVDALDSLSTSDTLAINGLSPGTYTLTATDQNACTETVSVDIEVGPAIMTNCQVSSNPSGAGASDGIIDVNITGGPVAPYTIIYDNGSGAMGSINGNIGSNLISNLPAGTYQITIQTGNTCTATCSVILSFQSCTFNLNVLTIPEICRGDSTGQATIIASGGQTPYAISWSTGDTTQTVMNLAPGAYFVTVTDGNGCIANQTANLPAGVAPPSMSAGAGIDICADSCYQLPVTFTGTPPFTLDYTLANTTVTVDRQLTTNNRQDSILICPSVDNIIAGVFEIQFNTLQDFSCDTLLNDTVFFNYLPPTTGTLSPTICPNDTITVGNMDFHANNPNGQVILFGSSSTGCDSTVNVNLSFFPIATGIVQQTLCSGDSLMVGDEIFTSARPNGSVVLENASVNGCDSTITVILDILDLGINNFNADLCAGDTLTIGGEIFTQNRLSGSVLLDNQAANGCDSVITVNLSLLSIAENRINTPLCNGDTLFFGGEAFHATRLTDTIRLSNAAVNGCDSVLYVDLPLLEPSLLNIERDICNIDTLFFGGQRFTADFLADTIILDNQSINGCDSVIQVNLTLRDAILGNLTTTLCLGDSLMIRDTIIHDAGQYQVLLPGGSATGCDSLVSVALSYYPPAINNLQTTLCPGDSLVIGDEVFNEQRPMGQALLNGLASNGCDSIVDVNLQYFPVASGSLMGTYCFGDTIVVGEEQFTAENSNGQATLIGAAENGCDSLINVDLTFLPASVNNLDSILCFNDQLVVGNDIFNRDRPDGIVVLENANTFGCDSIIFVNTTYQPERAATLSPDTTVCGQPNTANVQLRFNEVGTYDFTLLSTDGNTASESGFTGQQYDFPISNISQDVTISIGNLVSDNNCPINLVDDQTTIHLSDLAVAFTVDQALSCENTADGIVSAIASGGEGSYNYTWSTGNTDATLGDLSQGTYTLIVSDESECLITDSVTLTAPLPMVVELSPQAVSCTSNGVGLVLIDTISGGTGPFEYSIDNQFFDGLVGFPTVVANLAAGDYTLFVQDARDCQENIAFTILPAPVLEISLGEDETISLGDSVFIKPDLNFDAASWEWTPRSNLRQPDSLETYANPERTTVYNLTAIDSAGCITSDLIQIIVKQDIPIYIPTAFSPNNDDTNELLVINAGQGVAAIERFQIFDRWGNQVFSKGPFQPNDPLYGWDGRLDGQLLNAGVFVYFVEVRLSNGKLVMLEGDVLLLR